MHNFSFPNQITDEIAKTAGFESLSHLEKVITGIKMLELKGYLAIETVPDERQPENQILRYLLDDFLRTAPIEDKIKTLPGLYHDMLTGALNRRAFEELPKQPVIVMIDLDDFKDINDILGHEVGDETLKVFTQAFNKTLSKHNLSKICRYGGDEFIFSCSTMDEADQVLQSTRPTIAIEQDGRIFEKEVKYSAGKGPTISEADRNLRAAKQIKNQKRERVKFSRMGA
ncbi:MAG: GGDEF domain-containing protein [Chitinophagales bacterium]